MRVKIKYSRKALSKRRDVNNLLFKPTAMLMAVKNVERI